MKKIFILLFSIGSFTTLFAQNGRDRWNNDNRGGTYTPVPTYNQPYDDHHDNRGYDNRNASYDNRGYDNRGYDNRNSTYDNRNSYPYNNGRDMRDNRNNDWQRQQEIDRVRRDYDNRIDTYRRDRSLQSWDRDRRIHDLERERDSKIKSFAGGLILGGVLGVLLGH